MYLFILSNLDCTWIVLLVHAVRSPDDDVVRPPRELLDVGTIVGEGDGTSEVSDARRVHVRDRVEILNAEEYPT